MRQIRRSGLATLLVTGGALALSAGAAHADSGAQGAAVGSPGVGSGNTVQLPVHAPVNVCGNTVNVVGLLNPAFGNGCANRSAAPEPRGYGSEDGGGRSHKDLPGTPRGGEHGGGSHGSHGGGAQGGSSTGGGSTAEGRAEGSPGVLSGNGLQLPVDLPVNVSGNSVNVVGLLNPVFGNTSVNGPSKPAQPIEKPTPRPQTPVRNVPVPQTETETEPEAEKPAPAPAPQGETRPVALAETGADTTGYAAGASAALLLGGALLYRRARRAGDQA
ncbi:chaplin [Streptomyces sp. NPDC012693]|jgi:LPXTG-motif cell wall-anchored protein|uniref:chaplin n=1 Tax=unclassified Streptomyces TaxID=2593676 RepID=UPI00202E94A1|nr:chaplin [Streptomyces sp. MSC1_001]